MNVNAISRGCAMVLTAGILSLTIVAAASRQDIPSPGAAPKPVLLKDMHPSGELQARLLKSFDRMEEEKYQPHAVFLTNKQSNYWPGDTEGRTVLALTLLAQATDRSPRYLEAILDLFPERMNRRGYFGDIHPAGVTDEQQLSGHGWALRGLCEHYLWTQDPATLQMIREMVAGLVMSTAGQIERYPIDPEQREHGGSYSGTRRSQLTNDWYLSTDIGCVFIFMDGVIQAYAVDPSPELKSLIDEMVALYNRIPFLPIKAQTHATLTGARGLLRYYELTGDPALVKKVEEVFATYQQHGMTETYENYNWFGRPTHSEPCAIIDSFMVAMQLWRYTGKAEYLDAAQHIYYNGICGTQRENGGFGCNSCAGAEDDMLTIKIVEAHWCCTMRGGEGLARVAESSYFTGDDAVYVAFHADNQARLQLGDGHIVLQQRSEYPFRGRSTLKVVESDVADKIELRIYAPPTAENFKVCVDDAVVATRRQDGFLVVPLTPRAGAAVQVSFDLKSGWAAPVNEHTLAGTATVRYGPLVLAALDPDAKLPADLKIKHVELNRFDCSGVPMVSVYNLMSPEVQAEGDKRIERKVMFTRGGE